jgi:hypothetical protein
MEEKEDVYGFDDPLIGELSLYIGIAEEEEKKDADADDVVVGAKRPLPFSTCPPPVAKRAKHVVAVVNVSKQPLGAHSLFFRRLFAQPANAWAGASNNVASVFLESDEERAPFMGLLRTFYGAPPDVSTTTSLFHTLLLADRFLATDAIEAVRIAIHNRCDVASFNVLFRLPASVHFEALLADASERLVDAMGDLNDAAVDAAVMGLCAEALVVLLASDILYVVSENVVWSVLARWLDAHGDETSDADRERLIALVRYDMLTAFYREDVVEQEIDVSEWQSRDGRPRCLTGSKATLELVVNLDDLDAAGRIYSERVHLNGYTLDMFARSHRSNGAVGLFINLPTVPKARIAMEEMRFSLRTRSGVWRTLRVLKQIAWEASASNGGYSNLVTVADRADIAFDGRLPGNVLHFQCIMHC